MRILLFNSSPRKDKNTGTLLSCAAKGAASAGADTEIVQLYGINYKGCSSCFSCKRLGSKSYGKCALKDDLTPVFDKCAEADALILGAPVYLGWVNAGMQAFIERLAFQYLPYSADKATLAPKRIPIGFIYTFGATDARIAETGYDQCVRSHAKFLEKVFGHFESIMSTDTYQFDDYSKYETSGINLAQKEKQRKEVFPKDMEHAYGLGQRIAEAAKKEQPQ
jgi:multimeric flavodoxin WrbA